MFAQIAKLAKGAVIITVILCAVGSATLGHTFWVDVGHTLSTLVGQHKVPHIGIKK